MSEQRDRGRLAVAPEERGASLAERAKRLMPDTAPVITGEIPVRTERRDGQRNLHAPNERVLLDELERTVVAEAELFREFSTGSPPRCWPTSSR